MTDQHKASALLRNASRVLTWPESVLCDAVRNGWDYDKHEFDVLCNRLSAYLT